MGEIHHADDAEHHRIADGDETVDRTERDAVDELLGEDFHARAPGAEASPHDPASVKLYQGAARPATAATLRARALWARGPGVGARRAGTKVPRERPDYGLLTGPMGQVFSSARAINEEAVYLRPASSLVCR